MTAPHAEQLSDHVTVHLGDCRDILPMLPQADAVVTDPPYGLGLAAGMGGGGTDASGRYKRAPRQYEGRWDDERPSADAFKAMLAAAPKHIIWGGNYFTDMLPQSSKWLYWDKLNSMPSYSDGEMAWTSLDGNAVKQFNRCNNGSASKRDGTRVHPTQKPLDLTVWCIGLIPPPAVLIVDPFMGSGTTGVAAVRLDRKFIGIEIEPKYFDIACRRISDELKQFRMPIASPSPAPKQIDMLENGK